MKSTLCVRVRVAIKNMNQNTIKTSALLVLLIIFLLIAGIVGWREFEVRKAIPSSDVSVYTTLSQHNAAYQSALDAEKKGDYVSAIAAYQSAASSTTDMGQQFAIQIALAGAYIQADKQVEAVQVLQALAADTSYAAPMRAYAVYLMGSLYSGSSKDELTNAIFSVDPYTTMVVEGNTSVSYRHLFQYSASISPNAYSDVQVAYWYAARARAAYQNPKAYASSTADYIEKAHVWLTKADTDPSWDSTAFASTQDRLFLLMRRAVTAWRLQDAHDPQAEDPETLFKQLVAQTPQYPRTSLDAYARLQYAYYLYATEGNARIADISALLAPLYASDRNVHDDTSARAFLASSAKNTNLGNRAYIVGIAAIDPGFKQYLVSLGWAASDFAKK